MCCFERCSETQECLKRWNTGKEKRAHRNGGVPEKKRNGSLFKHSRTSQGFYINLCWSAPAIYIWYSLPQGYTASWSAANEHRVITGQRRISKFVWVAKMWICDIVDQSVFKPIKAGILNPMDAPQGEDRGKKIRESKSRVLLKNWMKARKDVEWSSKRIPRNEKQNFIDQGKWN